MGFLKKVFNFKSDSVSAAPVIVAFFLLTAGVITFFGMSDDTSKNELASVSSVEFAQAINENDDVVLIDVRTPREFEQGHLSGAVNIDHGSSKFDDLISELDMDSFYAIYCRSGRRSKEVLNIMKEKGFSRVIDLKGGIEALVNNEAALKHFDQSSF